jgi:hypothetical protein
MREGPIDLTLEPNRACIQLFDQDRLKEIPRLAAEFAKMVASVLELQEFTRVGLRLVYWKVFPEKEAAAEAMVNCGLLRIPEGKHFGVGGLLVHPEIAFRKEEGGKGFSVRIKAEGLEYKLELPYLWHQVAKSVSEVHEQLSFDVDCYLQGSILLSQIAFEDWIVQTLHAVRRDSNSFLGV